MMRDMTGRHNTYADPATLKLVLVREIINAALDQVSNYLTSSMSENGTAATY